jgi:RNA polymerase sigma-70 factor (ECF subfamily)
MVNENNTHTVELSALKRGDKHAFTLLVDAHSDQIYRLAFKMLGDEQDAEDILQETFIKALKNIQNFEGRSKLSTWLYRIAVNEALMLLRKRKGVVVDIDQVYETEEGELMPRQITDWCCLPEKELMSAETHHAIDQAIQTLSDANRAAFLLRDVEGLSTQEAAEVLNISESALKVRLMRARMALRESLTEYFADKIESKVL